MCEKDDLSISRSAQVACAAAIKTNNYRENRKRGCEGQIEDLYLFEKLQRTIWPIQRNNQIHSQVGVSEAPKKMQEEY